MPRILSARTGPRRTGYALVLGLVAAQDDEEFGSPQILPGGDWVLSSVKLGDGTWDEAQIAVHNLDSNERKVILEGGSAPRYLPSGHIVYAQANSLFAFPFDLESLERTGGSVSIVEGVQRSSNGIWDTANYLVSDNGTLAYVVGGTQAAIIQRSLVTVDLEGNAIPLTDELRDYFRLRLSPDGSRVAAEVSTAGGGGLTTHIWIVDIENGLGRQLTFEGTNNQYPTWTANSQTVVFQRDLSALYQKAADGSGEAELLFQSEVRPRPTDVSSDGVLAFYEEVVEGRVGGDIWTLQLEDSSASEHLATPANERMAMFSPDGQWLAYRSDESGLDEVYVRPYPQGTQRLVSDGGGTAPIWARDGSELYYRSLSGNLMAVPIQTSPTFVLGRQRELFPVAGFRMSGNVSGYDIDGAGEGFIMVSEGEISDGSSSRPQINIVLNWFEELKERVPIP